MAVRVVLDAEIDSSAKIAKDALQGGEVCGTRIQTGLGHSLNSVGDVGLRGNGSIHK
jgi:hypothetical protein